MSSACPDVLVALLNDAEPVVRQIAAKRTAAPAAALAAACLDPDPDVVVAVAGNSSTPPDSLDLLAAACSDEVRKRLLRNPTTSPATVAALGGSQDAPELTPHAVGGWSTPPDVLASCAKSPVWEMRSAVAANQSTPPLVLDRLARDSSLNVRRAVAANHSTLPATLGRLSGDRDEFTANIAYRHPAHPPPDSDGVAPVRRPRSLAAAGF